MGELPPKKKKETARPFEGEHKMGSLEIMVLVVIFAFIVWGTYALGVWIIGQFALGMSQ